jgi:hypothetical protein
LPAKSPPNAEPRGLAAAAPSVDSDDSEMVAAGRQLAEDLGTADADEFSSPAERRAAERTARRRQRAEADDAPARRGDRPPKSRVQTQTKGSMFGDSLPAPLIAVIAGGVLGVILGALSVGGWAIGLLAAALTVVLLRVLGSHSPSTRAGTK